MVPAASGAVGVRVAMVPAALSATVAGTLPAAPAARRVKVAIVIVAAFTGLLNVAETVVLRGTLVAPFGGVGRATCRERVEMSVAAVALKKEAATWVTGGATVAGVEGAGGER